MMENPLLWIGNLLVAIAFGYLAQLAWPLVFMTLPVSFVIGGFVGFMVGLFLIEKKLRSVFRKRRLTPSSASLH